MPPTQRVEQLFEAGARLGVERGEGPVEQNDARAEGEGAGDAEVQASADTQAEGGGVEAVFELVPEPDRRQAALDPRARVGLGAEQPAEAQAREHVVADRHGREGQRRRGDEGDIAA